jgi:exopolysaccharide production protein ExoQ
MLKRIASWFPYLVFLSLPAIALTKGKGTVILLAVLFIGFCLQYRPTTSLLEKIKDYKHPLCWAILFVLWCGFSILWSNAPWADLAFRYIRLIGLMGMGAIAYGQLKVSSTESQDHFYTAFWLGYLVYLVFYVAEITTNGFTHGYNQNNLLRGVVVLSFLLWPFLGILKKKMMQISVLGIFLWLIYGISPDAAFLGMAVASVIYFVPQLLQKLILSGILLGGILTPWISKYLLNERMLFDYMRFIPTSHQHRIFMWEEISSAIMNKPIFGHGFDFASFCKSPTLLCNHYVTEVLQTRFKELTPLITYSGGGKVCDGSLLFGIHPHNGFLQIWLELGGIGILLFSIFMALFYRLIQHNRLAVAMLGFYAIIFSISFNMWQNWMIATLWLGVLCLFVVNHRQKHPIQ